MFRGLSFLRAQRPFPRRPSCDGACRVWSKLSVGWSVVVAALTANLGGYRPNAPKDLFAARGCEGERRAAAMVDMVEDF